MKTSFLTYYKTIMTKVSFDRYLLRKEYRKALRSLHSEEVRDFKNWLRKNKLDVKLER